MKIAYDAQIFFEQSYGGASRYFCEIASRISKLQDMHVSITAPLHINAYLEHLPPHIISGFRLPRRVDKLSLSVRGTGMLIGDLMLRFLSPDIIHETYYFPYRLGPQRSKRVLTIHDMIHEKFVADFDARDRTSRFKLMSVERADHIICVSEATRRDVMELLDVSPDRISVIYHGFNLMDDAAPAAGTKLNFDEPFILYVGNRGRYKNFLGLLQAYSESKELTKHCRLVCFGSEKFNVAELEAIEKYGLNRDRVIHIGGGDQILASLYKSAAVFVYPSLYEGFGIPPLEAMYFDCPVVCSKESSIPEVVGDAGEYFDPKNIDDMREAVERVFDSDSRRNELMVKGRQRLKMFSWDRCAEETADVYRKLS